MQVNNDSSCGGAPLSIIKQYIEQQFKNDTKQASPVALISPP